MFQFIVHLFYPFTIPLYLSKHIYQGAKNQILIPVDFTTLRITINTVIAPLAVQLAGIWYLVFQKELEAQGIQVIELLFVLGYFVLHRIMVGVKYGFMSEEEINWFTTSDNRRAVGRFMLHKQMISGWFNPNIVTINDELNQSQVRLNVRLNEACVFEVQKSNSVEIEKWKRFLGDKSWEEVLSDQPSNNSQNIVIKGIYFCESLVQRGVSQSAVGMRFLNILGSLLALFQLALPGISRVTCSYFEDHPGHSRYSCGHGFAGDNWIGYVFNILLLIGGYIHTFAFMGFLFVALNDMKRKLTTLDLLGSMIEVRATQVFGSRVLRRYARIPTVNVKKAEEIRSWLIARLVLQDFGFKRSRQINVCLDISMGIYFIFIIYFIALLIQNAHDPSLLRSDMSVQIILLNVIVITIYLFAAFAKGSKANHAASLHRLSLLQHRLRLHDRSTNITKANNVSTPGKKTKSTKKTGLSLRKPSVLSFAGGSFTMGKQTEISMKEIASFGGSVPVNIPSSPKEKPKRKGLFSVGESFSSNDDKDMILLESLPSNSSRSLDSDESTISPQENDKRERILNAGIQLCDSISSVDPVKFAGLDPRSGAVSSLLTMVISGFAFMVQQIYFTNTVRSGI